MIIVNRKTGERVAGDELPEEAKRQAALAIFQAFCQQNRELVAQELRKEKAECTNPESRP